MNLGYPERLFARIPFVVFAALALSGCYRSHLRGDPDGGVVDANVRDAPRADAPTRDAPEVDAGPIDCDALAVTGMVSLDEGVTPRIVALPGGDVGVVYVRTDGDPTRVVYERLDRTLTRVTGPVTVATDSFTWAELAVAGEEVLIAYGLAGSRQSVLAHVTFDGSPSGERQTVPLQHPSIFDAVGEELLWGAFEMTPDNALVLAHVTRSGVPTHPSVTIPFGRYGSGHHAARRPDGSHILGYPREGPPGARHGYVNVIDEDGALGPERQLDPIDSDRGVTPVFVGSELLVVRETEALVIERTDPTTLERLESVSYPLLDGVRIAGALAGRLVVAQPTSGLFRWDFFSADLATGDRYEIPLPDPGIGSGTSVAEHPGAIVFAMGLTSGSSARPWVVRIECVD